MQIATKARESFSYQTHPDDGGMLMIKQDTDIPLFTAPPLRGGIWQQAMPEDVLEFFIRTSVLDMGNVARCKIPIDPTSGALQWSRSQKAALPEYVSKYIERVSHEFNKAGNWPAIFIITHNLAVKPRTIRFHSDTKLDASERQHRALITVSDNEEDRQHETEWIITSRLSESAFNNVLNFTGPYEDMPEDIRTHVRFVKSGDMICVNSLGEGMNIPFAHACLHRAPPVRADTHKERKKEPR